MDGELDFSRFTDRELLEARISIDRSKFPLNASRLESELKTRQLSGVSVSTRPPNELPAAIPLPQLDSKEVRVELVDIDSLQPREQFRIFWGFIWRSYAVWLASVAAAFLVAVIAGVFLGMFGPAAGLETVGLDIVGKVVGFVVALLAGWFFTWHFLRWILKTRIGNYRLLLGRVKNDVDT